MFTKYRGINGINYTIQTRPISFREHLALSDNLLPDPNLWKGKHNKDIKRAIDASVVLAPPTTKKRKTRKRGKVFNV